jgi:hypothetical protein
MTVCNLKVLEIDSTRELVASLSTEVKINTNQQNDLSVYANYRVLDFVDPTRKKEPTLNSRIVYTDRFFNQLIQSTSVYETNSGIPQQEFTYLKVAAGQGVYT